MPVPEPDSYDLTEFYQLLTQMNQKLDTLALVLQNTNTVLEKWPAQMQASTVKLQEEPKEKVYKDTKGQQTVTSGSSQLPSQTEEQPSQAISQQASGTPTGGDPNSPHGQEEPMMLTTPQGVTIVRF